MNQWIIFMLLTAVAFPTRTVSADLGQIIQTITGAEGDVKGSMSDVNGRTLDSFKQIGVQSTGLDTENSGTKQTLKGTKDGMQIEVQLTQSSAGQIHVIVTAKQGVLNWNKDFAQQILSKIIQTS